VQICSLQPPAHAGSQLADFFTLKMEAIRSSETSVNARSTQRHISEDDILHSHRCESLKSYKKLIISYLCSPAYILVGQEELCNSLYLHMQLFSLYSSSNALAIPFTIYFFCCVCLLTITLFYWLTYLSYRTSYSLRSNTKHLLQKNNLEHFRTLKFYIDISSHQSLLFFLWFHYILFVV
jgi:hypothetical protein